MASGLETSHGNAVPIPAAPAPSTATESLTAAALRQVLAGGQVDVWFQPKIDLGSGAVVGAEVLLRRQGACPGSVSGPGEILAAAERFGMMSEITRLVLDRALAACAGWLATGLRVPVAVNVTPQDLADPTLPEWIQALLDGHSLSGELLILEITESAVLQDIEGASAVIERLRRLGVALSIDDFGVGYSSMARLVQLQLAELKVDMSLVLGLHVSAEAAPVVKAVIDLGHALGMRVVAEGVEDERSLTELRSLGCDLAQGYVFTPAVPASQFAAWVADQNRRRVATDAERHVPRHPARASVLATWVHEVVDAVGLPMLAATAALLLAYLAWQVFRWGGPSHKQLIGDLAFLPLHVTAIVAAVLASRANRHDRATKWAWGLLAAAFIGYLAATGMQIYYELGVSRPLTFPTWADFGYLITYPLVLIGLLCFPVPRRSRDERLTLALDVAIVAVGGAAVIWFLDLAPITATGGDRLSLIASLAYPVGDLVLMFGAVSLLLRDPYLRAARPLRLLLLGFGVYLVTDLWYTHLQLAGAYQGGDLVDTGWIIALVLLTLAGVAHVRRPTQAGPDPSLPPADVGRLRSRLPYAAVLIAYAILVLAARRVPLDPLGGLVVAAAGITGLVTLRQMASSRENLRLLRRYHALAATDGLTGLHNRRHLLELAQAEFATAHRSERPLSLLMIDIDHFKEINDRFGHNTGDQMLRAVAEACRNQLRPADLVGRYGGDELIAVLPDTDTEAAMLVAARLQSRLNRFLGDSGVGPVPATLSIGVAESADTRSLDALLARADVALYAAKRAGRNCVRSYA